MSTKTTIKRIALVAVSALGFGLMSVAPSSAATTQAMVQGISLATATSTPTVGSVVDVNFGARIGDVTGAADGDDLKFTGYISSYPTNGWAGVTANATASGTDGELAGDTTAGCAAQADTADIASGSTYNVDLTTAANLSDNAPLTSEGDCTATALQGAGKFSFTPTRTGDYTLVVWFDQDADGSVDVGEAVNQITITVLAAAGFSPGLSTSILDVANETNNAADEVGLSIARAAGTDAATIKVTLKDTNNVAMTGLRVSAEISGPGLVDVVATGTAYADAIARSDALTLDAATSVALVHVTADGTAGASTVTIKVLDASTLATLGTYTEKLSFYGTVSTLEVALQNLFIARASSTGEALGCGAAGCTWADVANTPAVYLVAKDSAGNVVPGLTITAVISDAQVLASATITQDNGTAGDGPGYYNASVTSSAGGVSGSSSTVTFRTQLSSGAYVSAPAVTFKLGGGIATGTVSLDKSSYTPGEAMVVTRKALDSSGNPVYDGVASPAVIFSKAIGGTAPAAGAFINGSSASSTSRPSVFAPSIGGAFEARATYTNATTGASTQVKFSATVSDDAAAAAANAV
jgi:hypothetical protein